MFRQFVSARTHCATTCLLAYVCVFICMQSIKSNQIKSNKEDFTLHYATVDDVCPDHGEVHNGQD